MFVLFSLSFLFLPLLFLSLSSFCSSDSCPRLRRLASFPSVAISNPSGGTRFLVPPPASCILAVVLLLSVPLHGKGKFGTHQRKGGRFAVTKGGPSKLFLRLQRCAETLNSRNTSAKSRQTTTAVLETKRPAHQTSTLPEAEAGRLNSL